MLKLKGTNNIGRPCGYAGDSTQADHAWYYAQSLEGTRDRQDTEANLGLHHENNCSKES